MTTPFFAGHDPCGRKKQPRWHFTLQGNSAFVAAIWDVLSRNPGIQPELLAFCSYTGWGYLCQEPLAGEPGFFLQGFLLTYAPLSV